LVLTKTTELITEVWSSELIQNMKCRASSTPAARASALSREERRRISLPAEKRAIGATTSAEIARRKAAIVSTGTPSALAREMRTAAEETATIPAPRTR
jgi:hypothetical protein